MRTLFHLPLSPACRKVRIVLGEKRLAFTAHSEKVWNRREAFLALNPAGEVPVLVEADGTALSDADAICAYLDEIEPDPPLLGATPLQRAETRRLAAWFDRKFNAEVTENLVGEKLMKRFVGGSQPNSLAIRAGLANIHTHLDYIAYLVEHRNWLAGDRFSLADAAAAAHLSAVDYLGDVPWSDHPQAKDWYMRIKSRPSMRPILADAIAGSPPPKHYANPDF